MQPRSNWTKASRTRLLGFGLRVRFFRLSSELGPGFMQLVAGTGDITNKSDWPEARG